MITISEIFEQYGMRVANVKNFGATGNGMDDDSIAIQNAAYSLAPTQWLTHYLGEKVAGDHGGLLYFPPGCYRITNTLSVFSCLTVQGAGEQSQIYFDPQEDIHHAIGLTVGSHSIQKSWYNINFKDFQLSNAASNSSYPESIRGLNPFSRHGIYLENTRNCLFENVTINGFCNGTALTFGYATDETNTGEFTRSHISDEEKSASTTKDTFLYNEVFFDLSNNYSNSAYQWGWCNKLVSCYFSNNHLDVWCRNGSTTASIEGGEMNNSTDWWRGGDGYPVQNKKQYHVYGSITGLNIENVIFEGYATKNAIRTLTSGARIKGNYFEIQYGKPKADIKIVTGTEGGYGDFSGNRGQYKKRFDLTDESWDFSQSQYDSAANQAFGTLTEGSPIEVKDIVANPDFDAGMCHWMPYCDVKDISKVEFSGWDNVIGGIKAQVKNSDYFGRSKLTLERTDRSTESGYISNVGSIALGRNIKDLYKHQMLHVTCLIKIEQAHDWNKSIIIKMGNKALSPYIYYPNGWTLYVASVEPALTSMENVSIGLQKSIIEWSIGLTILQDEWVYVLNGDGHYKTYRAKQSHETSALFCPSNTEYWEADETMLAMEWGEGLDYVVGDYVYFDDNGTKDLTRWECTTAHTSHDYCKPPYSSYWKVVKEIDQKMDFACIGDKVNIQNIRTYVGGFPAMPQIDRMINTQGVPLPFPDYGGSYKNYTPNVYNWRDRTRWLFHVKEKDYEIGDRLYRAGSFKDMSSNPSVYLSDGFGAGFECIKAGHIYTENWSEGETYPEDFLIKYIDEKVYRSKNIENNINKPCDTETNFWEIASDNAVEWRELPAIGHRECVDTPVGQLYPLRLGELVFDTNNLAWYISTGTGDKDLWGLV